MLKLIFIFAKKLVPTRIFMFKLGMVGLKLDPKSKARLLFFLKNYSTL